MKVCILTDSTAGLKQNYIEKNDIKVVHLSIIIDDKEFLDGVDITNEKVFQALKEDKSVSTSQPAPNKFVEIFERLKAEGYTDVIGLLISSKLSGTYQSAKIASEMVEGIKFHLVDTLSTSIGQELLISRSLKMLELGIEPELIAKKIMLEKDELKFRIVVDDLKSLVRGGRLSKVKSVIGNIMRIKPVIILKDGAVEPYHKVRTLKSAIQFFVDEIEEDFLDRGKLNVYLSHTNANEMFEILCENIRSISEKINLVVSKEISPVIAMHIGEGALGVVW